MQIYGRKKDIDVWMALVTEIRGSSRALYKKFGFVEDALTEEFGYPTQRFVLPPEE